MQVRNNEIFITRGESFTMSKLVQNRDGSPYIISSRLKNPYWKITISSSIYQQDDRYVFTKWLELKNLHRFEITQPVRLSDYNLTFEDNTLPFLEDGTLTDGEIDFTGEEGLDYANVAVFYQKYDDGTVRYKYWKYYDRENNYDGEWVDYKCPIITTFGNSITSQWIAQNYFYSIVLVDGNSTSDYLTNIAEDLEVDIPEGSTNEYIYDILFEIKPELLVNVDLSKPLYAIDELYLILESTKIYVKN